MPNLRKQQTDDQLVDRARAGDHAAFAVLLRRHDEAMRRLAFRLLADAHAMDDVLQEAYLRAYRALPDYGGRAQFGSWLYRITYNACIDELRLARRRPLAVADPPEVAVARAGTEGTLTTDEVVRNALAALPADQRVTVVLVDGEGFDNQSAARILGVAPGTIASRLSRARLQLRHTIGGTDMSTIDRLDTLDHRPGFWNGVEAGLRAEAPPIQPSVPPPLRPHAARRAFTLTAVAVLLAVVVAVAGLDNGGGAPVDTLVGPAASARDDTGPAGARAAAVGWAQDLAEGDMAKAWDALGPASKEAWASFATFDEAREDFAGGFAEWAAPDVDVSATKVRAAPRDPMYVVTFTGLGRAYAVVVREARAGYTLEPFTPHDTIGVQFLQPPRSPQEPVLVAVPDKQSEAALVVDGSPEPVTPEATGSRTPKGVEMAFAPAGGWAPGSHVITAFALYGDGTPAATAIVFDVG